MEKCKYNLLQQARKSSVTYGNSIEPYLHIHVDRQTIANMNIYLRARALAYGKIHNNVQSSAQFTQKLNFKSGEQVKQQDYF